MMYSNKETNEGDGDYSKDIVKYEKTDTPCTILLMKCEIEPNTGRMMI